MKAMREDSIRYEALAESAKNLGVTQSSLLSLGAAYSVKHAATAFPMKDGDGKVCGIRLRSFNGFKWAVTGSRQGLFLPEPFVRRQEIVFLPEGPTDSAAFLSLGLYPIGRPTCNAGLEALRAVLRRLKPRFAVIVADNDETKRMGAQEVRPGIVGATRLRADLKGIVKTTIWIPPTPCKDVRQFIAKGGTRALIESDLKNKVWK